MRRDNKVWMVTFTDGDSDQTIYVRGGKKGEAVQQAYGASIFSKVCFGPLRHMVSWIEYDMLDVSEKGLFVDGMAVFEEEAHQLEDWDWG